MGYKSIKAAVYTLGCKLNQCESEALASSFDGQGLFVGTVRDDADIFIINTCTVTSKAEQKARRMVRKLSTEHPESVVIVTGCYAQLDPDDLSLGENVIVVPHDYKNDINRLAQHLENENILPGPDFSDRIKAFFYRPASFLQTPEEDPDRFWYDSVDFSYHTRAFLKIQDGCDNSCAYCRVTIARGDSTSLKAENVLEQFSALVAGGYREVVLTGVNISSYNSDGLDFSGLLAELAAEASRTVAAGNPAVRIRLSSLEPETIDDRMASAVSSPFICPHFHIPVQSGSDRVLSLMRRHNNREKIINAVKLLRSVKDDPYIAADVIAGFPGETDEDFELSRALLEECDFTCLHVFPFSARPGTAAASMKNQVPQRISGERTKILRRLSQENSVNYAKRWLGREVEVLIEEKKAEKWSGTSGNYLKSEVCDIINDDSNVCLAEIYDLTNEGVICNFKKWI